MKKVCCLGALLVTFSVVSAADLDLTKLALAQVGTLTARNTYWTYSVLNEKEVVVQAVYTQGKRDLPAGLFVLKVDTKGLAKGTPLTLAGRSCKVSDTKTVKVVSPKEMDVTVFVLELE